MMPRIRHISATPRIATRLYNANRAKYPQPPRVFITVCKTRAWLTQLLPEKFVLGHTFNSDSSNQTSTPSGVNRNRKPAGSQGILQLLGHRAVWSPACCQFADSQRPMACVQNSSSCFGKEVEFLEGPLLS